MLTHTFLTWGAKRRPQVHVLTRAQVDEYHGFQSAFTQEGLAQACTFGYGTDYAVPAVPVALELIALEYQGAHQERVRYMAACLLLGRPIEPPGGEEGGQHAILIPPVPQLPPGGAAVEIRAPVKVAY
jgi:hypothetical protein